MPGWRRASLFRGRLIVGCGGTSDSASAYQQPDDQHNQQKAANAAPDYGAAVIVAAATTEKEQQNQDNQYKAHRLIRVTHIGGQTTLSWPRNFRDVGNADPEVLNGFNGGSQRVQAFGLSDVAVGMVPVCCMNVSVCVR